MIWPWGSVINWIWSFCIVTSCDLGCYRFGVFDSWHTVDHSVQQLSSHLLPLFPCVSFPLLIFWCYAAWCRNCSGCYPSRSISFLKDSWSTSLRNRDTIFIYGIWCLDSHSVVCLDLCTVLRGWEWKILIFCLSFIDIYCLFQCVWLLLRFFVVGRKRWLVCVWLFRSCIVQAASSINKNNSN